MPDYPTPSALLQDSIHRCNRTELYQLCRRAKLHPRTSASREELMSLLLGHMEGGNDPTSIDLWRKGLKGFVEDNRSVLQPQLVCPIRDDINACQGCLDTQVMACVVEQRDYEELIQIRRNRK